MKIRKILSGFVAGVMVAALAAIPVGAATKTMEFKPTGAGAKYVVEVTGRTTISKTTFGYGNYNDSITLNSTSRPGGKGVITKNDGSGEINVTNVSNVRLNNASITDTSGYVGFGVQTRENQLTRGDIEVFTWKATLTLADQTKHPLNDYNLRSNNFTYNAGFSMYIDGKNEPIVFNETWTIDNIEDASSSSTFSKDTPISVRSAYGRLSVTDKESLRNGSNFKITATLKESSNSSNYVGFNTDLCNPNDIRGNFIQSGSKTITFDIPKYFIYNEEDSKKYGEDLIFENFYISFSSDVASILLTYTEGSATTTTTTPATTTTTKPSTSTPAPSDNQDAADEELTINYEKVTINVGSSIYLKASSDVSWKASSNRNIARSYSSGRVEGIAPGTATVSGVNAAGDRVTCEVTVQNSSTPTTSFALKTQKGTVYVGTRYTSIKNANITPASHTDKITYTSSDKAVATVSTNGDVTVVGVGKVTITATTSSGLTSSCTLTARNPSLSLTSSTASISVGGSVKINATAKPSNSKITYESLNESVATVDSNGNVKGVSKGTAEIEVVSSKGGIKIFKVTVK